MVSHLSYRITKQTRESLFALVLLLSHPSSPRNDVNRKANVARGLEVYQHNSCVDSGLLGGRISKRLESGLLSRDIVAKKTFRINFETIGITLT